MDSSTSPGMCATKMSNEELVAIARGLDKSFDELQMWLCLQCQECCKVITIQTNLKDVYKESEFNKFYVEARGISMLKVKNRGVFLSLPHTCPHLMPGIGCDIYDSRPMSCRRYDGRLDPVLKDICKWNLLDAILREEEDEQTDN